MVAPKCFGITFSSSGSVSSASDLSSPCTTLLYNTPTHNILSTAPQLSIYQKALGMLIEDGNVILKRVGATINN
jgi:hypothetical protein